MPSEAIFREVLSQQGIEYAACDAERRVYDYSHGLVRLVNPLSGPVRGRRLEALFDELAEMERTVDQVRDWELPSFIIEKVFRQLTDGRQVYLTFSIFPYAPGVILMVRDVTTEGELEQRVTQQRNELDLLTGQLAVANARLDNLLHRFMPAAVADQAISNPDSVRPGGERRVATVLFADVRGFTSLAEITQPEEIMHLLNEHFSLVGGILNAHGGTINQYSGDMVMAIFNAPRDLPGHALQAVQAGLEIQQVLSLLRQQTVLQEDWPVFDFGIGINTGLTVAGYLGCEGRFDYTAIGNTTNIAARLASQAEGGQVLIGARTWELVQEKVKTRAIGTQTLRGVASPQEIYEALSQDPSPIFTP